MYSVYLLVQRPAEYVKRAFNPTLKYEHLAVAPKHEEFGHCTLLSRKTDRGPAGHIKNAQSYSDLQVLNA